MGRAQQPQAAQRAARERCAPPRGLTLLRWSHHLTILRSYDLTILSSYEPRPPRLGAAFLSPYNLTSLCLSPTQVVSCLGRTASEVLLMEYLGGDEYARLLNRPLSWWHSWSLPALLVATIGPAWAVLHTPEEPASQWARFRRSWHRF